MLTISKGVSWTPGNLPRHPLQYYINTVSLLPVCQMFMSSVWMYHIAIFCTFLCKAMWSTAHRYYSAGAGNSVALKQFSPSSCILRKETYLLTKTCYTKHIYAAFMLYTERRGIKIMNGKFLHDMLVNWLYGGIRTLLFLWWAITVEPVLKGICIERPIMMHQLY